MCKRRGIKFGIAILPFKEQIKEICPDTPQKMMAEFLSKNRIPFLNLIDILKRQTSIDEIYLQGDNIHPNKLGHYIIVKAISRWIISESEFYDYFKRLRH